VAKRGSSSCERVHRHAYEHQSARCLSRPAGHCCAFRLVGAGGRGVLARLSWCSRLWAADPGRGSADRCGVVAVTEGACRVDYRARLRARFHRLHNIRRRWIRVYVVDVRRGDRAGTCPIETLRADSHADIWWP
jgi:hypothetical protein